MVKIKKQLDLFFPENLVKEPVICMLSKKYDFIFNIRVARITETRGELVLELEGEEEIIAKAIKYLEEKGVSVKPLTHDIVE